MKACMSFRCLGLGACCRRCLRIHDPRMYEVHVDQVQPERPSLSAWLHQPMSACFSNWRHGSCTVSQEILCMLNTDALFAWFTLSVPAGCRCNSKCKPRCADFHQQPHQHTLWSTPRAGLATRSKTVGHPVCDCDRMCATPSAKCPHVSPARERPTVRASRSKRS